MDENNLLTAIFWDYENVGFSGENLSLFLSGLEEIKQKIEGDFVLKCFSHWNNVPETTQNSIMNAGFELSHVPQTKKNAVDQVMMLSAVNLAHQNNLSNFILISSDGDFTALCRDLQTKKITISIISGNHISDDLKPYAQSLYFFSSEGVLYKHEQIPNKRIIEIIEQGIIDARNACEKLNHETKENIKIYSKNEWKKAYDSYEKCLVSPFILQQIFNIDELYKIFLQVFGFMISKNYENFCLLETAQKTKITDLNFFTDLPDTMMLRIPIQQLSASKLSVFKKETKKPKNNVSEMKSKKIQDAIIQAFNSLTSDQKVKNLNISILNQLTCKKLGISTTEKIYKKAGYSTFTKAVESVKGSLSKNIKIKNGTISW